MPDMALLRAARALKSAGPAKTPSQRIQEAKLDVTAPVEALIEDRLSRMPETARATYLRAMKGNSKAAGIKAFCSMCLGWDDFRNGIRNCSHPACPLFPYRPYQEGA